MLSFAHRLRVVASLPSSVVCCNIPPSIPFTFATVITGVRSYSTVRKLRAVPKQYKKPHTHKHAQSNETQFNVRPPSGAKRSTKKVRQTTPNTTVQESTVTPADEPADEQPDPSAEPERKKRSQSMKRKRRVFKEPTEGDAAHPSSPFFQPLNTTNSSTPVNSVETHQTQQGNAGDTVAGESSSRPLPTVDVLTYDAERFVNATTFRELKVASQVHTKLPPLFGITQPTPVQHHAVPFLMHMPFWTERLRGGPDPSASKRPLSELDRIGLERRRRAAHAPTPRDVIIQDMTGSGKTLAYVLPMLSLIDNFQRHTQGIILVPTRELAVQIYRLIMKLNARASNSLHTKRKKNPLTVELSVGRINADYAANIAKYRPHIIIATPKSLAALMLPPSADPAQGKGGFGSISLQHIRMFVADEIDHLYLPFSEPTVSAMFRAFARTRSHGSTRRQGRFVFVTAAISERVHILASSVLNNPVTATSDALLNGWVAKEKMLKDRFFLPDEAKEWKERKAQEQQGAAAPAAEENPEDASDDPAVTRRRKNSAAFEEADSILPAEDDEESELEESDSSVVQSMDEASWMRAEAESDDAEELEAADEAAEDMDEDEIDEEEEEAEGELEDEADDPNVIRSEEFKLPGSESTQPNAGVSLAIEATTAEANEHPAGEKGEFDSDPSTAQPLPLASDQSIRFLPPTLQHIVVHVSPKAKLAYGKSHDASLAPHLQRQVLQDKAKLLSQLHSILKPRVAMVFFSNGKDAVEIAKELKNKKIKARLLLSNARLTVKEKAASLKAVAFGSAEFLFATDQASRGLDIPGLTHVINFDPPKTALDYVHRAGRVERLGGKLGCTVVNIVKDDRVKFVRKVRKSLQSDDAKKKSKRPSTFSGPQVQRMRAFVAQLHLNARDVVIQSGAFQDFVPPTKKAREMNTNATNTEPANATTQS